MTSYDSNLDFTLSSGFYIGRNDLSTHAPSEIDMDMPLEQIDVTPEDMLLSSLSHSSTQNSLDVVTNRYLSDSTRSSNAAHDGYDAGSLSPYRNDNANSDTKINADGDDDFDSDVDVNVEVDVNVDGDFDGDFDGDGDSGSEDISAITSYREISLEEENESHPVHNRHHVDRYTENRSDRYNSRFDLDDHDHDLDIDMPIVIDMSIAEITVLQQMLDRELMITQRKIEEWHRGSSSINTVTSSLTSSSTIDTEAAQCPRNK